MEAYGSRTDDAIERLRAACATTPDVECLGTVRVPEDETTFYLLAAAHEGAVRDLLARAGVAADRVVAAETAGLALRG